MVISFAAQLSVRIGEESLSSSNVLGPGMGHAPSPVSSTQAAVLLRLRLQLLLGPLGRVDDLPLPIEVLKHGEDELAGTDDRIRD